MEIREKNFHLERGFSVPDDEVEAGLVLGLHFGDRPPARFASVFRGAVIKVGSSRSASAMSHRSCGAA